MKKLLLAAAIGAALSGAAFAQTNVTIYGIVDAGIAYKSNGNPAGNTVSMESGQQSGSRLGFKGFEDLGGGLSAIFTLENGLNLDDGKLGQGGRIFGRQAWVGLNGGFGAVKLGRQLTALYSALDQVDPFHINLAGNAQKVFGYGTYAMDPLSRTDNTISYFTPNLAGFTGTVSYGLGETAGDNTKNRNLGAGASYVNGPLNVQFAYQKADTFAAPVSLGGKSGENRALFIGGTYDFSIVKAHLAYADNKIDGAAGSGKDRNWLVGVSVPVGAAGTVLASYTRNDIRDLAAGTSDQYAIGYTHALSKRTNLYTSYSYLKNDANVALNTFDDVKGAGANVKQFNVGVRHQF
jgi:predicted porin